MSPRLRTRARASIVTIGWFLALAITPPASAVPRELLPTVPATTRLLPDTLRHLSLAEARPNARRARAVVKSTQYVATIGRWQGVIDRCRGPVAFDSAVSGVPWILAEHVHCGGRWVLSARAGATLRINNGPLAGTWKANGRSKSVPQGSRTTVTRGLGALVAQTCIPGTRRVRLVGFNRA